MHIAIDGRELFGKTTGVGRYVSELIAHWSHAAGARQHHVTVYTPEPAGPAQHAMVGTGGAAVRYSEVPGAAGTVWEQWHLARAIARDRPDVFLAPAYGAPLFLAVPTVIAIHDVSFCAHPEWFRWREGLRRRWVARLSARRARLITTMSAFSQAEIVRWLAVAPSKVHVVPLGVDARWLSAGAGAADPEREPIILFVGSVFNRRHLPELIAAFARVVSRRPAARLVIVGENRTHPHEDLEQLADKLGVTAAVHIASYLPEADLRDLFSRASVFAFLSEYEGFGLTPLEALASGIPIVVRDVPISREVYDDAAVYVDGADTAAVAEALSELLVNDARRRAILARGQAVLERYRWEDTAHRTLTLLEEAANAR